MRSLVAAVFVVVAGPLAAAASTPETAIDVEADEILSDPQQWHGRRVAILGELVGDYSRREDGVWVQVNDDSFVGAPLAAGGTPGGSNIGMGARIPREVFEEVDGPPGRYLRRGPIVRLEGTFHHADPTLQGETYLAVEAVTTLRPSQEYPRPGPDVWLGVGGALLALAGVTTWRGRRERSHA